jgi:hypothetical protein
MAATTVSHNAYIINWSARDYFNPPTNKRLVKINKFGFKEYMTLRVVDIPKSLLRAGWKEVK